MIIIPKSAKILQTHVNVKVTTSSTKSSNKVTGGIYKIRDDKNILYTTLYSFHIPNPFLPTSSKTITVLADKENISTPDNKTTIYHYADNLDNLTNFININSNFLILKINTINKLTYLINYLQKMTSLKNIPDDAKYSTTQFIPTIHNIINDIVTINKGLNKKQIDELNNVYQNAKKYISYATKSY